MRILLAEDNLINQELLQDYLEDTAYEIAVAENGLKATQLFACERFDAILMDCHMPVMDGFEATRVIRELERRNQLSPIPIIAVTAHAMQHEQEQCFVAGMSDYLCKPFSRAELLSQLEKWTTQRA